MTKSKTTKAGPRRWRIPLRLSFTTEGKWFCGITLLIGFAAVNTGNNLLYLLLGMMLSLIVISGILCNISLSRLEVKRSLPQQVFAQTPCLVTLSVTNQKRYFPSFSIEIEDRITDREKGKKCYFLKVGAKRTQKTAYRLNLERRGLYSFQEVRISSKFPFSLFVKTRIVPLEEDVIVFPRLYPVQLPTGHRFRSVGFSSSATRGMGSEFFSLRDMRPGDELRWIHWPTTARTGQFQVREFEDEQRFKVDLMLWHIVAPPQGLSDTPFNAAQLDQAIDLAASMVVAFFHKRQPIRFSTCERRFELREERSMLQAILTHLALLAPLTTLPPQRVATLGAAANQGNVILLLPQTLAPTLPNTTDATDTTDATEIPPTPKIPSDATAS